MNELPGSLRFKQWLEEKAPDHDWPVPITAIVATAYDMLGVSPSDAWWPISEAPKDGTRILAFDEMPIVVRFVERFDGWETDVGDSATPKFYQSLPPPPSD